jgi:hypothetical protein
MSARLRLTLTVSVVLMWVAAPALASTTCSFVTYGTTMRLDTDCTTDATISIPDGVTLDGEDHTITAVDPSGGHFLGAVIANAGNVANVRDLKIVGKLTSTTCDLNNPFRGIQILDGEGSVEGTSLIGIHRGPGNSCIEGKGIVVIRAPLDGTHPNTGHVVISDNYVKDFPNAGIQVEGDVVAKIEENDLFGGPSAAVGSGRFVIFLAYGATGTIEGNTIQGSFVAGGLNANGIVITDVVNTRVSENVIRGSNFGLTVQALCQYPGAPATTGNSVRENTVIGANIGIYLLSQAITGTVCNPHVDNNEVEENVVTDAGGFVGIDVLPTSNGLPFTPVANRNVIEENTIKHYSVPISNGGTNTVVEENKIVP